MWQYVRTNLFRSITQMQYVRTYIYHWTNNFHCSTKYLGWNKSSWKKITYFWDESQISDQKNLLRLWYWDDLGFFFFRSKKNFWDEIIVFWDKKNFRKKKDFFYCSVVTLMLPIWSCIFLQWALWWSMLEICFKSCIKFDEDLSMIKKTWENKRE